MIDTSTAAAMLTIPRETGLGLGIVIPRVDLKEDLVDLFEETADTVVVVAAAAVAVAVDSEAEEVEAAVEEVEDLLLDRTVC